MDNSGGRMTTAMIHFIATFVQCVRGAGNRRFIIAKSRVALVFQLDRVQETDE